MRRQALATVRKWCVAALCASASLAAWQQSSAQTNACPPEAFYSGLAANHVVFSSSCTLTLTNTITVATNLVIDAGTNQVILRGSGAFRLFVVETNGSLTIKRLTLTNGRETTGGGGAFWVKPGGMLFLTNCVVAGNSAIGVSGDDGDDGSDDSRHGQNGTAGTAGQEIAGGAIFNEGEVLAINSSFLTNAASGGSGGNGGIGGNGAWEGGDAGAGGNGGAAYGGAIYNLGIFTASNCVFSANTAAGGSGGDGGTGGDGDTRGNGGRGGIGAGAQGAAIYSQGSLSLTDCSFTGQTVTGGNGGSGGDTGIGYFAGLIGTGGAGGGCAGGAIYSLGTMTLIRSTVNANAAKGGSSANAGTQANYNGADGAAGGAASGAGVYTAGADVSVVNCTFHGNQATGGAGANGGDSDGTAGDGGNGGNAVGANLCNAGSIAVLNSTVFGGKTTGGTNGVSGKGTFAGTDGRVGQSLGGNLRNQGSLFEIANSITAYPTNGANGSGTFSDLGYNISSDGTVASAETSFKNTNPRLGALGSYGGNTQTMIPLSGSKALNAGDNGIAPETDQRGFARPGPGNSIVDIGAVEAYPPEITSQPVDAYAQAGGSASFRVTVSADPPAYYQWRFLGTNLPAATNAQLTLTQLKETQAGPYQVVITNAFGSVTSQVATLFLGQSPAITTPPASQVGTVGGSVTFSAVAAGTAPLAYQWRFQGTNLPGQTATTLVVPNLTTANGGSYTVVVTNQYGTALSAVATLRVTSNVSLSFPTVGPTNFGFTFAGQPGFTYVVQYKDQLTDTNWSNLKTNISVSVGTITNLDTLSSNRMSRFYRVVIY